MQFSKFLKDKILFFFTAFVVSAFASVTMAETTDGSYSCILLQSNSTLDYVNNIEVTVMDNSAEYKMYDGFGEVLSENYFSLLGSNNQNSVKIDTFTDEYQHDKLFVANYPTGESSIVLFTALTPRINFLGTFYRCQ